MAPCSVMSILNGLNSQNSPSGVGPHFNGTHPDAPPPHSNVSSLEIHGNARRIPFFRWLRWAVKSNDLLAMRPHVFGGFSQKQHLLGYLGRDYCVWIDYRHGDILADPIKNLCIGCGTSWTTRSHYAEKKNHQILVQSLRSCRSDKLLWNLVARCVYKYFVSRAGGLPAKY